MTTLLVYLLALLFSAFVGGVLVGSLFSKSAYKKLRTFADELLTRRDILLSRVSANPVLAPTNNSWETEATFNPAAVVISGRTHLLYRAIGNEGISRLGYASSTNGIVFDERLPYPAYTALNPRTVRRARYAPTLYPSGGSWGGCEDPRMVKINGRIYVSFSVFDGWDFIRMGVMSIPEKDFLAKRFYAWSSITLISPPGQIHKNWVLFPEKINDRFAFIHSITPKVEVAYCDSIEAIGKTAPFIQSWVGPRDANKSREGSWDNHVRGAGPPPLKTAQGWLLFYHAVDENDDGRYKLGVMLLDQQDPTNVICRANVPILSPDKEYENCGKPGTIYACGAVIKDEMLYIYYGGGDRVACVAFAPLNAFLDALTSGEHASLTSVPLKTS